MSEPTFSLCNATCAARLATLRNRIAPILSNRVHRHYTDHSVSHSDRVAVRTEKLAAPLTADKRLSNDEAFILYAACYAHDVGMQNERAGLHGRLAQELASSGTTWSELSEERRLDLLRKRHHEDQPT
jgi:HD superfamily phosphodiesterase